MERIVDHMVRSFSLAVSVMDTGVVGPVSFCVVLENVDAAAADDGFAVTLAPRDAADVDDDADVDDMTALAVSQSTSDLRVPVPVCPFVSLSLSLSQCLYASVRACVAVCINVYDAPACTSSIIAFLPFCFLLCQSTVLGCDFLVPFRCVVSTKRVPPHTHTKSLAYSLNDSLVSSTKTKKCVHASSRLELSLCLRRIKGGQKTRRFLYGDFFALFETVTTISTEHGITGSQRNVSNKPKF